MQKGFLKFRGFVKRHKWSILLIVLALAFAGFFLWDNYGQKIEEALPDIIINKKEEPETVRAPLSGRLVAPELAERKPMAVVVENSPDARPQSGLNKASIVFETFAEGGITRFLAIYQEEDAGEIGPVRSARPYFVDWAYSYKALFAHVGGNANALEMIQKLKVLDINQFFLSKYFWRDRSRFAPHNVYTSTKMLLEAAVAKKYPIKDTEVPAFRFKDDLKAEERPVNSSFKVIFNNAFAATYNYSREDNFYYRVLSGVKHKDRRTGEQIRAKNVIVCFSDFSYGRSKAGEQMTIIRTTGTGSASFFVDGSRVSGTWQRKEGGPIKFYNGENKEILLNAGTTWVDFVPKGTKVQ